MCVCVWHTAIKISIYRWSFFAFDRKYVFYRTWTENNLSLRALYIIMCTT